MTVLDVGAVVGRVTLDDAQFQRAYMKVVGQMEGLGRAASAGAAGTVKLDESMAGLGRTATTASSAVTKTAASEEKAARAAQQHAAALGRVDIVMQSVASESARVQESTLRQVAAQQRLAAASADAGTAEQVQARETARLASAQASAMTATRGLAAAQDTAAASTKRFGGALGGTVKMAAELGLLFGAFEAVKKVIDITKEAGAFQQSMLLIQTNAGASAAEVKNMSAAVLAMAGPLATAPDQLAAALYHVEQNGLRGQAALDALKVGAEGAKIGMASVEDTTNTMTIAMASGIHGVQNLQQAMGFMIATVGTGDMRLKDLNEALSGGILAVAKGFGASLRDVAAVLATLGDNGIRGADAATALRQTLMGFASPAKGGADALKAVGLSITDLRDSLQKHGLVAAMNDLEQHMTAAGVTGNRVGGFITQAFGRKAGAGIAVLMGEVDRLNTKYGEAEKGAQNFGDRWAATTRTAAFQFHSLGAAAQAEGVRMATAVLPVATIVAGQLGGALHEVAHLVGQVGPAFAPVFQLAGVAITGAAYALHGIASVLSDIAPVIKVVAAAWAGMFLGQMAARAAVAAVQLVQSAVAAMPAKFAAAQASITGFWTTSAVASSTAAATMAEESAIMSGSAVAASETVVASGEAARVGWVGLAGPLAAAALGVFAVVSMFHKSSDASKEATDAARAFTEALASGSKATLLGAIVDQLSKNNIPQKVDALNASLSKLGKDAGGDKATSVIRDLNTSLARTPITAKRFADAISQGGAPLAALRRDLLSVVDADKKILARPHLGKGTFGPVHDQEVAAAALLKDLDALNGGMDAAQKKEIATFKAFGTVAAPVTAVAQALRLSSAEVTNYAGVLGLAVTKNGDLVDATKANQAAILSVAHAYDTASQSGSEFLSSLESFSKSSGTSADRAALIGSTLKAANGDALAYAGALASAYGANHQLVDSFRQQRQAISDARAALDKAKVGTSEYTSAQHQLRDALAQSELAAINLKTGTIKYSREGAGPLVQQLQGIQSAAMAAASATYQHARSTESGTQAADDAYKVYRTQTRNALLDEATQLGLTSGQAKKLADKYFGMPKKVKTLIEQEGANPVVDVLNRIGQLLANLTGQQWDVNVVTHYTSVGTPPSQIQNAPNPSRRGYDPTNSVNHATGGAVVGPGTGTSDSIPANLSNGEHVWTADEVQKVGGHGAIHAMRAAARAGRRVLGFAAGGGITTGMTGGKKVWEFAGQQYASLRAAENARARAGTKLGKLDIEIRSKDLPAFLHALTGTTAALIAAERTLSKAAKDAGLTHTALARVAAAEKHLNDLSRQRNSIAGQLGAPSSTRQTAWEQLEAARSAYQGERSNVASTISGGFDLAQAGRSSGTGVTLASIMGDAKQQRANDELFNKQLAQLQHLGLGKAELQNLAEKGFAGAESSTVALLGASRAQIRDLNGNVAGLGAAAGRTGTFTADLLYGADVRSAQKRVDTLTAQEHRIDARMAKVAREVAKEITRGLHIAMPKELVLIDEQGVISGKMRVAERQSARAIYLQGGRA